MRKVLIIIVTLIILAGLTGCEKNFLPIRHEIDDLQLVQVIGIDKSGDDSGRPIITIASKKLTEAGGQENTEGSSEGEKSKAGKARVLTAEGKTVFDAVRNIQTHSAKTVFWSHTDYYLIGEEAAKENIVKYIDFFTRDHELRIEAKIFIVKGATAKEVIEQINLTDYFILDKLDSLSQNIRLLSVSEEMRISDLMRFIDIYHGSARLPCIQLVTREGDGGKKVADIDTCGYAIIADLKLAGFIERDMSRGINLITGHVGSSIVTVKDLSGQDASLEITQSTTEVIPYFEGDELTKITIKSRVKSNLGEVQSQMKITNEETIRYMERQQSEILENEMKSVLEKVLKFKSDCLNICDKIRLKRPLRWHEIEEKWMLILQEVRFDFQVESVIERTYEIRDPTAYRGEE